MILSQLFANIVIRRYFGQQSGQFVNTTLLLIYICHGRSLIIDNAYPQRKQKPNY